MSDLHERAEACLATAEEALANPDSMQIMQRSMQLQTPEVYVEFNHSSSVMRDENSPFSAYGNASSRYVYVGAPDKRIFSLNMTRLAEGTVEGMINNLGLVRSAHERASPVFRRFLELIMQNVEKGYDPHASTEMISLFDEVIAQTSATTYAYRVVNVNGLSVVSTKYENPEKPNEVSGYGQPLSLSVSEVGDTAVATRLDKLPNGSLESYEHIVDDKQLLALASEDDIVRTPDGTMIGLKNAHLLEELLAEMERSIGGRKLTEKRIRIIEAGAEVLKQAAEADINGF